jgi:hypothetical protein
MSGQKSVDEYPTTVFRLEPDIHPCDADAYGTSTAISLRRIADQLEMRNIAEARLERDRRYPRPISFSAVLLICLALWAGILYTSFWIWDIVSQRL